MRAMPLAIVFALLGAPLAAAQETSACRVLCAPEFSVEPTVTISNLFEPGTQPAETGFEVILSLGLPTRIRWLEFTAEAIFLPFDREATPELEFETNFIWLPPERTRGWVSSHFDVVDKFSPADRPTDRRAYTHKLNFELDTGVSVFHWLREGRWLRGVEVEGSLDYVATGLARTSGPWSFSLVLVIPVAPL